MGSNPILGACETMAEVKILIEGYVSADNPEGRSRSTVTLIKDEGLVIIVDPGAMEDRKMLIDSLKREGLSVDEVNIVCITHSHMDHYMLIGMFPTTKALDYWGFWDGGLCPDWEPQFTKNITIAKTPGHSYDSITLFVKTSKGTVAICGDVFWKENFPEEDPYASDKEKLKESRALVLKNADWAIPGHGKMFKTKK